MDGSCGEAKPELLRQEQVQGSASLQKDEITEGLSRCALDLRAFVVDEGCTQ